MVTEARKLALLERIARIKAERELKKFAAFSGHMTLARRKVDSLQAALRQCYASGAPLSVAEARIASAQAARSARELNRAVGDLERMTPRFEKARAEAAKEFGRAEVLLELARSAGRKPHRM